MDRLRKSETGLTLQHETKNRRVADRYVKAPWPGIVCIRGVIPVKMAGNKANEQEEISVVD